MNKFSFKNSKIGSKGVAIGIILPVLVFLLIIGLAFILNTTGKYRIVNKELDSIRASYLAEAALEEATWLIRNQMNADWLDRFENFMAGASFPMEDILMETKKIIVEMQAQGIDASLDLCKISVPQAILYVDPSVIPEITKYYNNWTENEVNTNSLNPAMVPYPDWHKDPSTNLNQGPPKDMIGTLKIEIHATVNNVTKKIAVSRDYKFLDITPPATEYALYVRQGPFGTDPVWPMERQINEEFNSGGKMTIHPCFDPSDPLNGLKKPSERRIHIKGRYIIDSSKCYELPDGYMCGIASGNDIMDLAVGGQYMQLLGKDPAKASDMVCFGPGIVPPPRCVYHVHDTSISSFFSTGDGKVHLLPEKELVSWMDVQVGLFSKFNYINGRRFNSGCTTHHTSLFGDNVSENTGIEGQVVAKYKQWWVEGSELAIPGVVSLRSKFLTKGGDELDDRCYAPYALTETEVPGFWDHALFGVWKNFFKGLVLLNNPVTYLIKDKMGWNSYFESPEMKEFCEIFQILHTPFILQEPGKPQQFYSNAKLDSNQKLDYRLYATRKVENLNQLIQDNELVLAGGILSVDQAELKGDLKYYNQGMINTRGLTKIPGHVLAGDDTSFMTLLMEGREYDQNSSIATIPPGEKVEFTGSGIQNFEGSIFSRNSIEIAESSDVKIMGNLTCDRVQKHAIKGDLDVYYHSFYLNNRFGPPADPNVKGMVYSVELSPSVSSWVDLNRKDR